MVTQTTFNPNPFCLSRLSPKNQYAQKTYSSTNHKLGYIPNENFCFFLWRLEKQSAKEWTWLIGEFRERLMPVLISKAQRVGRNSSYFPKEFAEEIFEECLLKFYELFEEKEFEKFSDLEATIVRISDFKIKEGYARIKRNQKLFLMDAEALSIIRERYLNGQEKEEKQRLEIIEKIKRHISELPADESDLIMRYFSGEELKNIADEYGISPEACRKRKQRIVEKLRGVIFSQ